MATTNLGASAAVGLSSSNVPNFIVESKALDTTNDGNEETYWYFSDAITNYGYYFNLPEVHNAANALATWAVGRGFKVDPESDTRAKIEIEGIKGIGFDDFETIMYNLLITKLVVGDAFSEIVRNDKGTLINLLPISPERVRLVF